MSSIDQCFLWLHWFNLKNGFMPTKLKVAGLGIGEMFCAGLKCGYGLRDDGRGGKRLDLSKSQYYLHGIPIEARTA